jgi:hypothetical protein
MMLSNESGRTVASIRPAAAIGGNTSDLNTFRLNFPASLRNQDFDHPLRAI